MKKLQKVWQVSVLQYGYQDLHSTFKKNFEVEPDEATILAVVEEASKTYNTFTTQHVEVKKEELMVAVEEAVVKQEELLDKANITNEPKNTKQIK